MSPEFGERQRPIAEIAEDFDAYAAEQVARFNGLSTFLTESLPIVENLDRCNAALTEAGRPDLAITERVEMLALHTPEEVISRSGNFAPNFIMFTDKIEPGEDSFDSPTLIPITTEELLALRNLPVLESFDEINQVEESSDFVTPFQSQHFFKPAFIRILVLFPEFTADLITQMSKPENGHHKIPHFEAELFLAYQLMSRLVDKSDIYVIKEGKSDPDNWYLCN